MFKIIDNLNRNIKIEDYKKCIDFIVNTISNEPWCLAIKQFGSINFPSISDIDMLFIIDDKYNYAKIQKKIEHTIERAPYSKVCFQHKPIIINKEDYKYIKLFHSIERENTLYIKNQEEINVKTNIKFSLPQIMIWNTYFYKIFFVSSSLRKINLRYFLLLLNNMAYSIKNNDMLLKTGFYKPFEEQTNRIRKACLNRSENIEVDIHDLFKLGLQILQYQENAFFNSDKKSNITKFSNSLKYFYKASKNFSYRKFYKLHIFSFNYKYFDFLELLTTNKQINIENDFITYSNQLKNYLTKTSQKYKEVLAKFQSVPLLGNYKIDLS